MRRVLVPLSVTSGLPPAGSVEHRAGGNTMGTTWSVRYLHTDPAPDAAVRDSLQLRLDGVVAQMSHWQPDSNLSRFNDAPPGSWHSLPAAFFDVLGYGLEIARKTQGAYDPCAGALVNCWGFGARRRYNEPHFYAPADAQIQAIVQRRDRERMNIEADSHRVCQPGDVQIDLSSIAKGAAVDDLALTLDMLGIDHYLVEVGGELRGAGMKPDGQPWWVALEGVPDLGGGEPVVVALHGLSVATSGDYRRYFQHRGKRASHTLDPRTGYPIDNGVASVTVLHRECMAADALSTALTVLGPQDGMRFAEREGLAARFLVRRGDALDELCSTAFNELLQ